MQKHRNRWSWLPWLAYAVGFGASAFFLFFILGEGLPEILNGRLEVLPLMLAVLLSTAGLWLSLSQRLWGLRLLWLGSLSLAVVIVGMAAGDWPRLVLIFCGPYVCSALLLMAPIN